jgi:type VII secretion-associated serine protease mycosin
VNGRHVIGVLGAVAACAVLVAAPAAAAPPPGTCLAEVKPKQVRTERPWEDRILDPSRVWGITKGAGVRVGVVDSGVDSDNPHLRGKVFPGFDFVRNVPGGRFDCAPHGTPVASIIVGAQLEGSGFRGMAPDARIVPARVTETSEIKEGPAVIAAGIRYAVDEGVKVLNLSLTVFQDVPELKAAVEYAQEKDVLVVAAAGNQAESNNPTPYPAAYPGVLGVGSIDINGARAQDSQVGEYVDLVAPGVKVTACAPSAGHELYQGTSFAAPFVAGTAALVRSAWPGLTAPQVAERLIRTASVSRGGARSPEYGTGVVSPYRAVTDTTVAGEPEPVEVTPLPGPQPDLVAERREAAVRAADQNARDTATTLLVVAIGGLVVGGIILAGRRRGWSPTRR